MRLIFTLLLLIYFFTNALSQGRYNCYEKFIKKGDSLCEKINENPDAYRLALEKYNQALSCDPSKRGIVQTKINLLFNKIVSLKITADSNAIKATNALKLAKENAIKADNSLKNAKTSARVAERSAQMADSSARIAKLSAHTADSSARLTEASRLITLATQFKQEDPTLALQLIKKACDTSYYQSLIAVQSLREVLSTTHPASYYKKKIEDSVAVSCMVVSGDGQRLIIGHNDGTMSIWHTFSQPDGLHSKQTSLPAMHNGGILSLATSYDGKLIVSAGVDGLIHVWKDKEVQSTLQTKEAISPVLSVALSANMRYIISSHENSSLILWDLNSGNNVVKRLSSGNALQVCFSPDDCYIGICRNDETVQVWDGGLNKIENSLEEHRGAVRSLAFSPDGNYIVSGGDDKIVRVWKWKQRDKKIFMVTGIGHQQPILSVAFSQEADFIVSAGQDNAIKVWALQTDTLKLFRTLQGHQKSVFSAGFLTNDPDLYSGSYDCTVKLWNWQQDFTASDSLLRNTKFKALTDTAHLINVGSLEGKQFVQDKISCRITLPPILLNWENPFIFSNGRRYILTQDNEYRIWLWDYTQTSRPVFTINTTGKEPYRLALDNTLIKSDRLYRNLYYELIIGQLIPTMTNEDRLKYLVGKTNKYGKEFILNRFGK